MVKPSSWDSSASTAEVSSTAETAVSSCSEAAGATETSGASDCTEAAVLLSAAAEDAACRSRWPAESGSGPCPGPGIESLLFSLHCSFLVSGVHLDSHLGLRMGAPEHFLGQRSIPTPSIRFVRAGSPAQWRCCINKQIKWPVSRKIFPFTGHFCRIQLKIAQIFGNI